MQIRQLNPADDPDDLAAALPVFLRWSRDYVPGLSPFGGARLRFWCSDSYRQQTTVLGAFADERATEAQGLAIYSVDLDKNLDQAMVDIQVEAVPTRS
jgi:hypothetical protein